jgi:hypothetical protein
MPLLEKGDDKRICFVNTVGSSNFYCEDTADFPAHVSRAPLNMAAKLLFNELHPEGYTFRIYCKDEHATEEKAGEWAAEFFIRGRSLQPTDPPCHSDENRCVLYDWRARELPF